MRYKREVKDRSKVSGLSKWKGGFAYMEGISGLIIFVWEDKKFNFGHVLSYLSSGDAE